MIYPVEDTWSDVKFYPIYSVALLFTVKVRNSFQMDELISLLPSTYFASTLGVICFDIGTEKLRNLDGADVELV
ncbi:unnamed protein product [Cylicocyclus nassatus]|uniref:Uncharacterized protein n=1 Tax=Cylicocyclus nassatus TaxID=53992 RepID=A0AA36MEY4_CYLNA|nr:unnamed protein product [Cylicocyclus nassatus]